MGQGFAFGVSPKGSPFLGRGGLARTTADLALLFGAVSPVACAALDPAVPPLPHGDPSAVSLKGLRVGVFNDDGFLTPARCLQRAVAEAREALEAAGAQVVPYAPYAAEELINLWLGAISADGGRTIDAQLRGEAISPQLKPSRQALAMPALARRALGQVLRVAGERRLSRLMEVLGEKRVDALWALTARRTALRLAELDAWNRDGLDAVICPPHVVPALGHRESGDFTLSLSYAFRWSLLNFPAGIVPVTRVRPEETPEHLPGKPDKIQKNARLRHGGRRGPAARRPGGGPPLPRGCDPCPHGRHRSPCSGPRGLPPDAGGSVVQVRGREGFPQTPEDLQPTPEGAGQVRRSA